MSLGSTVFVCYTMDWDFRESVLSVVATDVDAKVTVNKVKDMLSVKEAGYYKAVVGGSVEQKVILHTSGFGAG